MHRTLLGPKTLTTAALVASLSGCAGPQLDAQWRNVELPVNYLRGATVLVSCEASDTVVKQVCEDRVVADLQARGVLPILPAPGIVAARRPDGATDVKYLSAARDRGAKAIFGVTMGPGTRSVSPGVSLGLGLGGFGRNIGGGVGVSAPIGGGQVTQGYAAHGRVTDVASGRLMWTARANAPPSSDVNAQLAELSKSVVDAAAGAGLF